MGAMFFVGTYVVVLWIEADGLVSLSGAAEVAIAAAVGLLALGSFWGHYEEAFPNGRNRPDPEG
jgi:hypothetical protein